MSIGDRRRADEALPAFDGPRFAAWLTRWRDHERLRWVDIADRSGISYSIVQQLARGAPQASARARGQVDIDPRITTVARLAHGLDLEFGYVASRGLVNAGSGSSRWGNFSKPEREALLLALRRQEGGAIALKLLHELRETITEEKANG